MAPAGPADGSRNGILLILCALFCKASNIHVERLWYDVGSDAGWRGTIWTHERYVDHVKSSGQAVPAFFRGGHYGIRLENDAHTHIHDECLHTLPYTPCVHV